MFDDMLVASQLLHWKDRLLINLMYNTPEMELSEIIKILGFTWEDFKAKHEDIIIKIGEIIGNDSKK